MLKKFFTSFIISIIINTPLFSQVYEGVSAKEYDSNTEMVWFDEKSHEIKFIKFDIPVDISPSSHISWLKEKLKSGTNSGFKLLKESEDKMGYHYRYQQMYQGYPVDGYQYIIHTNNDNKIVSINGDYKRINNLTNTIQIDKNDAVLFAKKEIPSEKYRDDVDPPQIVIHDSKFAWKVSVYSESPLSHFYVFIDAENGKVIFKLDRIHYTDVNGTAHTKYHGVQTIVTDSLGVSNYVLKDNGRSIHTRDMNNGTNYLAAVNFSDSDNIWTSTLNQDDAALDAHYGAEMTYDYFYNTYGLDSYDGNGAPINSYVHYYTNYINAFWDGSRMTYGDGNPPTWTALTSLDVVGHEITHAVTQYSAGLIYSYESGALNESFSDIFGVVIDFYGDPSNANWYMGDLFHIGNGFRNLANPNEYNHPDTYLGNLWYTGSGDNGGVHINSGVQNFWFYLLVNGGSGTNDIGNIYTVNPIGLTDASAIAYRNLTVYLTPNSQYSDARFYSILSANDLFGNCSPQEISVTNSWYAVGVGSLYTNYTIPSFTESYAYSCNIPKSVSFINNSVNDTASLWDFGDGNTSTLENPTHSYTSAGNYTVTLTSYGSPSCGSVTNQLVKPNLIKIGNPPVSPVCTPTLNSNTAYYGVFGFKFGDIDHTIPPITTNSRDSYVDYSCSIGSINDIGDTINIQVNSGLYYSDAYVYVDWNNNGDFDSNELVLYDTNTKTHVSQIIVPIYTTTGVPLRIRVHAQSTIINTIGYCGGYNHIYESYADYSVFVNDTCPYYTTKSSGNWNDTSIWCSNDIPTIGDNVTISDGDSVFIINGSCNTLNIGNNSIVHIDTNGYLIVNNNIHNDGELNIMNNGSLIQLSNGINNGNGEYNLYRTGNSSILSYNIWSSPMTSTHIPTVFNNTNQWDIFYFDGIIQNWAYDYTGYGGDDYMDIGRGYFIPGDGTSNPKHFNGQVNNGIINFDVYTTNIGNNPNWNDDDWNLIGNPYPSAISVNDLYLSNTNVLSDGIYWWDNGTPPYDQYGDYAVMNLTGAVSSNNSNILPNGFISSGQGVFVAAISNSANDTLQIEFNNSMRDSTINSQFYITPLVDHKVWISLSDTIYKSSILVGIVGNSTDKYDPLYDAHVLGGTPKINLSSQIKNDNFIIQGISELDPGRSKSVDLDVSVYQKGSYIFKMDSIHDFSEYDIYLYDKNNIKSYTDIKNSNYTVSLTEGVYKNRFKVVFTRHNDSNIVSLNNEVFIIDNELEFSVVRVGELLNIETNKEGMIFIYDILGREVYKSYLINTKSIEVSQFNNGTYIIRFIGENETKSIKLVIVK